MIRKLVERFSRSVYVMGRYGGLRRDFPTYLGVMNGKIDRFCSIKESENLLFDNFPMCSFEKCHYTSAPLEKNHSRRKFKGIVMISLILIAIILLKKKTNSLRTFRTLFMCLLISYDYKFFYTLHVNIYRNRPNWKEPQFIKSRVKSIHERNSKRLYKLLVSNGGLFVKFGQFVASMNSFMPDEYLLRMSLCQNQVPFSISHSKAKKIISSELRTPVDQLMTLEREPVAAASIGQVFRAQTVTEGESRDIAVKIQYPNLEEVIKNDLFLLDVGCRLVEFLFPKMKIRWVCDEVSKHIPKEMDFIEEGKNCELCGKIMETNGIRNVRVPKVHWDLTTKKVLVTDYIDGAKVTDVKNLERIGIDNPKKVLSLLDDFFRIMIFREGMIHCDPHPGNFLVCQKEAGQPILYVIDHNPYVKLRNTDRVNFCRLYSAIVMFNSGEVQRNAVLFGTRGEDYEILVELIMHRKMEDVKNLRQLMKVRREVLKKDNERYIRKRFFDGTAVLDKMDKKLLFILKAADLIRSIHYELGVLDLPFFSFYLQAQREIFEEKIDLRRKENGYFLSCWAYQTILKCRFLILRILVVIATLFINV